MVGIAPYGSLAAMLGLGALAITVSVAGTILIERPYRAWTRGR